LKNPVLLVLLFLAFAAGLQAQSAGVQCAITVAGSGANVRADGVAELLPDVLLTCTGGARLEALICG
jgi:hypothetical protein